MSAPSSLTAALESAGESMSSSEQTQSASEQTQGSGQEGVGQAENASETGFIGFTPEQPAGASQQAQALRLAETLKPDTIVAYDGDKPITAQEFRDSFFRQSDYSKKTAEHAELRKQFEPQAKWFEQNKPFIDRLQSGDPEQVTAVLKELADAYRVGDNLAKIYAPAPAERQRGTDGKFAATPKEATLLNPDEYDETARPVVQAANAAIERANALEAQIKERDARFDKLEQTVTQFQQGLQTAQQQQQLMGEISGLAESWKKAGYQDVNAESAMSLVGQPITAEQAMFLAHREPLLAHNYRAAQSAFRKQYGITDATPKAGMPNEPGSVRSVERSTGFEGMNLQDRLASLAR